MTTVPFFRDVGAALLPADLDALEQRIGITLPGSYRAFLLDQNGGRVDPAYFGVNSIKYFCSIGGEYDIDRVWAAFCASEPPRVPREFLPIARCECGDLLLMGVTGTYRGKIYYWDHEGEGEDACVYDNLEAVASSLAEFLATLSHVPE